jgi:hypothetical protein
MPWSYCFCITLLHNCIRIGKHTKRFGKNYIPICNDAQTYPIFLDDRDYYLHPLPPNFEPPRYPNFSLKKSAQLNWTSTIITIFFINVYVVLFLFNNVIYVFLLYDCMFMYDYPDWGFSCAFSSVVRQMPGWYPQRRGTARTLPSCCVALGIFCVLCIFCVVLFIVCFVTFPVLFVCICILNNCHRVATQLQLNINISYIIKGINYDDWSITIISVE